MIVINAKVARAKYFEDYVAFENHIIKICKKLNVSANPNTLKELISELSKIKSFSVFEIQAKVLIEQKNCRNWLAHKHKNSRVNIQLNNNFNSIRDINDFLIKGFKKIKNGIIRAAAPSNQNESW